MNAKDEIARCSLCGEPMPAGEEMFKFHGYSGDCPKPHLTDTPAIRAARLRDAAPDMLAALKAAEALAVCGMAPDCYSRQEIAELCRGTIETFRNAISKASGAQP